MAYSVTRPTSTTGGGTRSRPKVSSGYSSALEGFSSKLADVRKTLVSDQAAAIDYQIETGSASNAEKIALYEDYLSQLEPQSAEWYRTSTKIENLKDQEGSMDFAVLQKMYSLNQISTEYYYEALKARAAEPNISGKEKQSRLLDLASFEDNLRKGNTDQELRDAATKESLGMISALDRYQIIENAYNNETDPARKRDLQNQLIAQQGRVYEGALDMKQLAIQKGIQEGTATKADLLPILANRIQTAATPKDALQAEIAYQAMLKDIQSDQVAAANKTSNDAKKETAKAVAKIDRDIETAKREGNLAKLQLLYQAKGAAIQTFMANPNVSDDDKQVQAYFDFAGKTLGVSIDPDTGQVAQAPALATDEFSLANVESSINNPGTTALKPKIGPTGETTGYDIVRGVQMPDGTVNFGEGNVAVGMIPQTITDAQGKQTTVNIPRIVDIQKLPDLEATLKARGQQAVGTGGFLGIGGDAGVQFTGEYVTLGKKTDPTTGKQTDDIAYILRGDNAGDYVGAEPVPGRPGVFLYRPVNGEIPTAESLVKRPEALGLATNVGANIQQAIESPFTNTISAIRNVPRNLQAPSVQTLLGDVGKAYLTAQVPGSGPFMAFDQLKQSITSPALQNQIRSDISSGAFQMPDFSKIFSELNRTIGQQLLASTFPGAYPAANIAYNTLSGTNYGQAAQQAVNNVFSGATQKASGFIDSAKQLGSSIYNKISSSLSSLFGR